MGARAVIVGVVVAAAAGATALVITPTGGGGTTASSVTQYGITFTFSTARPVGQYATGDYWVQAPVTITAITPTASSGQNGWMVNPPLAGNDTDFADDGPTGGKQAWDTAGPFYDATLMPSLPYTAAAGESIVKADTRSGRPNPCTEAACLDSAAVLTVVSSAPASDGATSFRPPYAGSSKPVFSTADLDANLADLPRITPSSGVDAVLPTLTESLGTVQRPDIGWTVEEYRSFHPVENTLPSGDTQPYAPNIAGVYMDAVLRSLVADTGDDETTRRNVLIGLVQRGIDVYGARAMGMHWYAAGGHNLGPMAMIAFAAWMLDNATLKAAITSAGQNDFAETGNVWANTGVGGEPVWGQLHCTHPIGDCEASYWDAVDGTPDESATPLDPYGYIDGGYAPSTSYEQCCVASVLVGDALMAHLIPGMSTVWDDQQSLDFGERWKTHGMQTQPDPCAPISQGGGPDPSGPNCVLDPDLTVGSTFTSFACQVGHECGRFPTVDGKSLLDSVNLSPGGGGAPGDWGNTTLLRAMWTDFGPP